REPGAGKERGRKVGAGGIHAEVPKGKRGPEAPKGSLTGVALEARDPATCAQYEQHFRLHIAPRIGRIKLAHLTPPKVEAFRDDLLANMSRPMARKVLTSLKSLLRAAKYAHVAADVSGVRRERSGR